MKNSNYSLVLVALICLSIFAGSVITPLRADEYRDAKKAYEQGQYDQALDLLIIKLRSDNDHKKTIELFRPVIKIVVDSHLKAAQENERKLDWGKAIEEYETLKKIRKEIASINPIEEIKIDGKKIKRPLEMPIIDIDTKLSIAINNAAEEHYLKAEVFFKKGEYETAIKEYTSAFTYSESYKDSREKTSESYYNIAQNLVSKEKYRDASKKFMSADDITGNYKNAKTLASKYEAMADEKDAQICYDKGTAFVNTDNFRDASIQFNKAVSFMPNFKDAQALATKYKTIADENDAQICYNKGKTLVNVGNFRDAVIQFNKAVSFVSNFKDAKALATKYKNMADEKDAQAHYEKGQALMNQNEFKGAEKEFLSANNYVKGYKDALLLAEKARSAMPNEAQIASAVTAALQEGIPVSWVGNLLGGSNAKLNSIKVEKIGIYNDRERYWPMQIRVIGSCLLNDPFNQGKEVSFDNIGDFILFKDDYGEWKAKMKGGMIR
ncbi:MAG: hypothetical protein RBR28_00190 [Lentimicrobium sp.]|jgi:tetratricopeptide (TPR) repeat protein|nr:hypothetical protein [Lentimicrobium sp.]